MRRTKIICTLGPAVDSEPMIRGLIRAGMDAARFNFSHGTHEEHLKRLHLLNSVRDSISRPVATVLDTKGPEIRIRTFAQSPVTLAEGELFTLTTEDVTGDEHRVAVTYENLHEEVSPGQEILIDDGLVAIRVEKIEGREIVCRVENGGELSNHKSINIPGANIHLPAVTDKDIEDIRFGVENDFDFIAASFVRKASDVQAIRQVLHECGGDGVRIIAKIENQEGVDNMEEIIMAADGVMVARGDLGVEIPAARVPIIQKKMIDKCLLESKPVITATQMLDSMIRNPRPTRAEVSDVANAVFDGTSCVMLSGETASGKYPIEALTAMNDIVVEAEAAAGYWREFAEFEKVAAPSISDAITHTSALTAKDLGAAAILTATASGGTARMIARFRPACPIVALTMHERVRRQLALCWGTIPVLTGQVTSTDRIMAMACEVALKERLVQVGDTVVITAGVPLGATGHTNLLKAHVIEEDDLL